MRDVAALLDNGAWTVSASERAQVQSRRLEAELRELLLRYGSRRVRPISGGSREVPKSDGRDSDNVRARVRLLVNPHETPKIFEGYSSVSRVCDVCGRTIPRGTHEYEIVFSALTFVLDRDCLDLWQRAMGHAARGAQR